MPSPAAVRRVLTFRRLSAPSLDAVVRALGEDDEFRRRVADQADEDAVGRVGWLWLHRPDGWADEIARIDADDPDGGGATPSAARLRRERDGAQHAAARHRREADEAVAARRRVEARLAELEAEVAAARADDDERATVDRLREERNAAVRRLKEVEGELAAARRDRNVARQATREAEAELVALRAETTPRARPTPTPTPVPVPVSTPVEPAEPPFDRDAVEQAVRAAAEAAAVLSTALGDAATALGPPSTPAAPAAVPPAASPPAARPGPPRARRRTRRRPTLPLGVYDDAPEAHRHLLARPDLLVLVDGYNLARTAWSGLTPEEERRRTVALLEEVEARSGAPVVVVFDGDDQAQAPAASRRVRVRFSATGITADDAIIDLVEAQPDDRAVLVVSSDRAVMRDALRAGAVVMGSPEFLAAAGR